MRQYLINNKIVTKAKWQEAFHKNPTANVVLRVPVKLGFYVGDEVQPISVENLQKYKRKTKKSIDSSV